MKKENKVEFGWKDPSDLKLEFDDISPFTGNKCVLIEADENTGMESRICMESGMTTTDRFIVGSRAIEQYEKFVPELYKDTKFVDQTLNQVWYLSTMRTHVACLYAQGTTKDDYDWRLAMVKMLDADERKKYPVDGKEGEFHTHIVDVENAKQFGRNEFKAAIDEFYAIIGKNWNENQSEPK
jgi:hypothetical protein